MKIWTEKFRPKDFSELVGQEHIVKRIEAFVQQKNMPHVLFAGPAGVGKCIGMETPIILSDGNVKPANKIEKGDFVLSLSEGGSISSQKVNFFMKRKARTIRIKTKLGNEITTTEEHPFLVLEKGLPSWKEASQLKEYDFVATPLNLPIANKIQDVPLDFALIENLWAKTKTSVKLPLFKLFWGLSKRILEVLYKKGGLTQHEITKLLEVKQPTAAFWTRKLTELGILQKINKKYYIKNKQIKTNILPLQLVNSSGNIIKIAHRRNYNNFSTWIYPFQITKEFCEWLGYILSEGTIKNGAIIFNNKNNILLDRFKHLTKRIFGIIPESNNDGLWIRKATTINKIMNKFFDVPTDGVKKSYRIKIPNLFFKLDNEKIKYFIRAYLDGDGFVGKNSVEFYSNSKEMLLGIKILLLRFSIISKLSYRIIKDKPRYKITIQGRENILSFKRNINSLVWKDAFTIAKKGVTNKDIMEINPSLLKNIFKMLNIRYNDLMPEKKIETIFEAGRGSRTKIQKVYNKICTLSREKLSKLLKLYLQFNNAEEKINALDKFDNTFDLLLKSIKDLEIRRKLESHTKIRSDRLLEYNQRKFLPNMKNILKILKFCSLTGGYDEYKKVYSDLMFLMNFRKIVLETINLLGISYNDISRTTEDDASNINHYLNQDGLSLIAVSRLVRIFNFVKRNIEKVIFNNDLIDALELMAFLSNAEIFWDRVIKTEKTGINEVIDFSIEKSHNFIGGHGPLILHNTSLSLIIAKKLFGDSWKQNFLDLNASDDRGIDVVRTQIKDFARTKAMGDVPFKIIHLDECDSLTREAQQALRRTMENFSDTCRFILSCNYSTRIIDPIQSRCSIFRFKNLEQKDIETIIEKIAKEEGLKIDKKAIQALYEVSNGDCRKMENILQSCTAIDKKITEELIYNLVAAAQPKEIKNVLEIAVKGDFIKARDKLLDVMLKHGLSGLDIIKQIQKEIWNLELDGKSKVSMTEKCGEIEFRMVEGSDEFLQLETLLASFTVIKAK